MTKFRYKTLPRHPLEKQKPKAKKLIKNPPNKSEAKLK